MEDKKPAAKKMEEIIAPTVEGTNSKRSDDPSELEEHGGDSKRPKAGDETNDKQERKVADDEDKKVAAVKKSDASEGKDASSTTTRAKKQEQFESHDFETDDEDIPEPLKVSITVTNNSTMAIEPENLQVRGHGLPAIGPDMFGFSGAMLGGFSRGFGFSYLWKNENTISVGETIKIECKTFTERNFLLVDCQCPQYGEGVGIIDGVFRGSTFSKDLKNGDHVKLTVAEFSEPDD